MCYTNITMKKILALLLLFMASTIFAQGYYVCIGSFSNPKNADNFSQTLLNEGVGVAISHSDNYYRVLLNKSFRTILDARDYRDCIKNNTIIKRLGITGMWVCCCKVAPKIIYPLDQTPPNNEQPSPSENNTQNDIQRSPSQKNTYNYNDYNNYDDYNSNEEPRKKQPVKNIEDDNTYRSVEDFHRENAPSNEPTKDLNPIIKDEETNDTNKNATGTTFNNINTPAASDIDTQKTTETQESSSNTSASTTNEKESTNDNAPQDNNETPQSEDSAPSAATQSSAPANSDTNLNQNENTPPADSASSNSPTNNSEPAAAQNDAGSDNDEDEEIEDDVPLSASEMGDVAPGATPTSDAKIEGGTN